MTLILNGVPVGNERRPYLFDGQVPEADKMLFSDRLYNLTDV
jgi:hypothetical protein